MMSEQAMCHGTISQRDENYATPVDAPMYGPLPTIYRGVTFNYVYFTTDPQNIEPLLPAPFEPGEDGICVAFSVEVPLSSSYGPFNEMGVVVQASFQGDSVFFLPSLYLDNDSAVAAGREIYGSPKKMAEVRLEQRGDLFVGTCIRNGIEIVQITTHTLAPAKAEEFIPIFPVYNLKMIPSVDKPEPAIKKITCTGVDNPKTHWFYRCAGSVSFAPTAKGGFWKLVPKEIIGASRTAMDYEQGYGQVVYDYLADL